MIFKVVVTRTQVQTVTLTVDAESAKKLKERLEDVELGEIDHLFDEGEVDSIDYEVGEIYRSTAPRVSVNDDLQDLL